MNYMFNIYYVHGLGSSKNSTKFKELEKHYEGIECLDWEVGDSLKKYIHSCVMDIRQKAKNKKTNIIISSSTGSNLAIQMQHLLNQVGVSVGMVLINPLFSKKQLFDTNIMPNSVGKYLMEITRFSDGLILLGENDTVVNHRILKKKIIKSNTIIEILENTHKLEDMVECFDDIDLYIVSKFFEKANKKANKHYKIT